MDTLFQDVRYGFRMLLKSPVFTLAAVLCLALGIGANAAIFSFLYGIVISPLPFDESHRLVYLNENSPGRGFSQLSIAYPDFEEWHDQATSFDGMALWRGWSATLTGSGEPERFNGTLVTIGLFDVLRVVPEEGRSLVEGDFEAGTENVVLISHDLWQNRFGSDPGLVGEALILDGRPFTVVGIMPDNFYFPYSSQIWMPLRSDLPISMERGSHSYQGVARLRDGISMREARTELNAIAARIAEEYPDTNSDTGAVVISLKEEFIGGDILAAVWIFYSVVCFILLLACANVANLMLARAAARQREIAVRTSIGASRGRVARMLLTESVVLALFGGGLGLIVGRVGRDLIVANLPTDVPYFITFNMHLPVILGMVGITMLSGMLFGLAPALEASNPNLVRTLQAGSGRTSDSVRRSWFRSFLVTLEVGLALVVLVGAGLMMKSFLAMRTVEPGFEPDGVLSVRIALPTAEYETPEQRIRFFEDALERIRAVPGVRSAAGISGLPMSGYNWGTSYYVQGTEMPEPGRFPIANHRVITPGYFHTLSIPLLQGRDFDDRDRGESSVPVAIVNETFARMYWPHGSALGGHISYGGPPDEGSAWMEVIGVVGDVAHYGLGEEIREGIYRPLGQNSMSGLYLAAKTEGDPVALADGVRAAIWEVDPNLPVFAVRSMDQVMKDQNWEPGLYSWMFTIFSIIALVLAAVGVYGVVAYSVAQRTREFGIRMALGADSGRVVGLVVRQGALLTGIGLAAGLGVALALMRFLQAIMEGVDPTDPVIYAGTAATMGAIALLASWMPARRATHVDPVIALRQE